MTGRVVGRRRWILFAAFALVAAVIVGGLVATRVLLDDSSRAVPLDVALERYRAEDVDTTLERATTGPTVGADATSTASMATTSPTEVTRTTVGSVRDITTSTASRGGPVDLVAPGVYRYRTTGEESIDALGGASHTYPPETTITVTRRGCGVHLRWDPLVERREEWELCATPAGIELQAHGVQFHQFFGQAEEEAVVCQQTVLLVPVAGPTSEPVETDCLLADDPWSPTWQVVGADRRQVDGDWIGVTHLRMTVDDEDEHWEHTVVDWYLAASGLPVAAVADKSSRSPSPIGPVVYREEFTIELISSDPLR